MVIYSTQPGNVALDGQDKDRNSPFAQAFLDNMGDGLNLQAMFAAVAQ
jgi:hypothetical protein